MPGKDEVRGSLFSVMDLERRVRADHPVRVVRRIAKVALSKMSNEFDALYPPTGRNAIPPEPLPRALLLQAFDSIRSGRQLVGRIEFNLLCRWFIGLGVDDPVWDATTFTENRDQLLGGEVAARFLAIVLAQPQVRALLWTEHFSANGTLLGAWASTKSFRPNDGSGPPPDAGCNGQQDCRGQQPSNDTHASTTDPDARLYRKGPPGLAVAEGLLLERYWVDDQAHGSSPFGSLVITELQRVTGRGWNFLSNDPPSPIGCEKVRRPASEARVPGA